MTPELAQRFASTRQTKEDKKASKDRKNNMRKWLRERGLGAKIGIHIVDEGDDRLNQEDVLIQKIKLYTFARITYLK